MIADNKIQFIGKKDEESIENYVRDFFQVLENHIYYRKLYATAKYSDLSLDTDTQKAVMEIKKQLDILKENGQFFSIV